MSTGRTKKPKVHTPYIQAAFQMTFELGKPSQAAPITKTPDYLNFCIVKNNNLGSYGKSTDRMSIERTVYLVICVSD
uniref:Ovule protein n=1 Tax=Panagrellus redivivus TaxID=6233 RepID=A0A7E4W3W6_PANRE